MGKKQHREKKPKVQCTREQRQAFADNVDVQLGLLGLTEECAPVAELKRELASFVESGQSVTGRIAVPEISRSIEYVLSNRPDPKDNKLALGHIAIRYLGKKAE